MKTSNYLILSTSPLLQPARRPHVTASFGHRQRPLYGRKRHYHTGKERDNETGLYYYGARYLDSKTGRWLSGDPAVSDYIPSAPINDEARKRNGNLPGQGGVFNYVNLHVYHYAGNNPVKYVDPDGKATTVIIIHAKTWWEKLAGGSHVAVHMSDPLPYKYTAGQQKPSLYDPSGHYRTRDSKGSLYRPGNGVFWGQGNDLQAYITEKLKTDDSITLYTFDTTPNQEYDLIEKAFEQGDSRGMWCARDVSNLLSDLGITGTLTPGNLEKQLDALAEADIVTKEIILPPTKRGNNNDNN